MVNTPIPHSLKSEARKAAKILQSFTVPNAKAGPDKIIPAGLIMKAQGLAIITVAKIGFLVTARGGSGIVIAKLPGGGWSAPSAIGIAGLGGGFEIGAEVTDFVIILNKRSAVEAFSKGGNLTLGGNFTIAVGPLGRNAEADVSVRSPAAIYTYSKTKGLFAGISVEGSALIERKDANRKFYNESIRSYDILSGNVDPPESCSALYEVLEHHEEMFQKAMLAIAKREARKGAERQAEKAAQTNPIMAKVMSIRKSSTSKSPSTRPKSRRTSDGGSTFYAAENYDLPEEDMAAMPRSKSMMMPISSSASTGNQSKSSYDLARTKPECRPPRPHTVAKPTPFINASWDAVPKAKAVYGYIAQLPCDLSFEAGDEIEIMTRTDTKDDWWEGKVNGKVGIFPANYVDVS